MWRPNVEKQLEWAREAVADLERNNISAALCSSRDEARDIVLSLIPTGGTVGYGDSITIRQLDILKALRAGDYRLLDVALAIDSEKKQDLREKALTADVFISGVNALTRDGKLVNMDSVGNRVAPTLFGPKRVILVLGINKLVADLAEAFTRIRDWAAPRNAARYPEWGLPCAESGICSDCNHENRICNKTVIIERQCDNERYPRVLSVVIVEEELGL